MYICINMGSVVVLNISVSYTRSTTYVSFTYLAQNDICSGGLSPSIYPPLVYCVGFIVRNPCKMVGATLIPIIRRLTWYERFTGCLNDVQKSSQ